MQLEDRLVPMYLLHRYQVEAVVKLSSGQDYDYAVKAGYLQGACRACRWTKAATRALLQTLSPKR